MKILILGLGHIGASLAQSLKNKHEIWGWDHSSANLNYCVRKKWVKPFSQKMTMFDLCLVCVPEDAFLKKDFKNSALSQILSQLERSTLVTDVFSSKGKGWETLELLCKSRRQPFCFSHPLAGKEGAGPQSADTGIWKGAVVLIDRKAARSAQRKLEVFWRSLGLNPKFVDRKRHQEFMAHGSHLMHVLAYALAPFLQKTLPSPSILGMTRVALSRPQAWAGILTSNRDALDQSILKLEKTLQNMREVLKKPEKMINVLEKSHRLRKKY